eukprot:scaffold21055_cov122-Isochrysis_galbana.AAC.7
MGAAFTERASRNAILRNAGALSGAALSRVVRGGSTVILTIDRLWDVPVVRHLCTVCHVGSRHIPWKRLAPVHEVDIIADWYLVRRLLRVEAALDAGQSITRGDDRGSLILLRLGGRNGLAA